MKSALLVANCRSVALDTFTGFLPTVGTVVNYVTSFDGASGMPLRQSLGGGVFLVSEELRPRAGQPGVYEADYLSYLSSGTLFEYGTIVLNLPTADLDGNGLPDVLQSDKNGSISLTGTAFADWPASKSYAISGRVSRNANSTIGSYSLTLATALGPISYSGTIHLVHVSGNVTYSRGSQNLLNLSLTRTDQKGIVTTLTGSTSFKVDNGNQISLPQFSLNSSDGKTYTGYASTLVRSGNKYLGNVQLADGTLETSWQDYINWVVEITDNNDSDGNGIPDLSDSPTVPLAILSQPRSQTVAVGAIVTLMVVATGNSPLSFQWRKDGVNIWGENTTCNGPFPCDVLIVRNVSAKDVGSYTVVC